MVFNKVSLCISVVLTISRCARCRFSILRTFAKNLPTFFRFISCLPHKKQPKALFQKIFHYYAYGRIFIIFSKRPPDIYPAVSSHNFIDQAMELTISANRRKAFLPSAVFLYTPASSRTAANTLPVSCRMMSSAFSSVKV